MHAKCTACCDSSEPSKRWVLSSHFHRVQCMFSSLQAMASTSPQTCSRHGGGRCVRAKGTTDCFTVGTPCTPFTTFRKNKTDVPPHKHEDFATTFTDGINYVRNHQPGSGFFEQVGGFFKDSKVMNEDGSITIVNYGKLLLRLLAAEGYFVIDFKCNNLDWLDVPRERHPSVTHPCPHVPVFKLQPTIKFTMTKP